jgi:hypothetical protein
LTKASDYRKKVIAMWTYRCYDDGGRPNLWQRWYDSHVHFQGTHNSIFDILEQRLQWGKPHADFFDKDNRILEVRLTGKVKYRILGFHSGARQEFVIIATCSHKQRVYDPKDIRRTAIRRKQEIAQNPARAPHCVRPR